MPLEAAGRVEELAPGELLHLHSFNPAEAVAVPSPNEWAEVREGRLAVFHDGRFHRVVRTGDPVGFFRPDRGQISLFAMEPSRVYRFDHDILVREDPEQAARLEALFLDEAGQLRARRVRLEQGLADYLARPGARIMPGPYHSRDVRMDLFVVDLKAPLEAPPHMLKPFEHRALMAAATFPSFGTRERVVCPFVYAEIAIFVPVVHPARGPALYCPELRPDNLMALLTGREMQGFPKRFAQAVLAGEDSLSLVIADEVRSHLRFERQPVGVDDFVAELASMLWPGEPLGRFSGLLGRLATRVFGLDSLLVLAPRVPMLVRHRAPPCGGLPAIDELRGVPFRFDPDRSIDPVGLPRFASPRAFQRLEGVEARSFGDGWYPGEVLGGWSLEVDVELGEARRLGLEGLFGQLVESLRGEPEWPEVPLLPETCRPDPEREGERLRLARLARVELQGEGWELVEGRVALFEGEQLVDLVEAPCALESALPLVLDGAELPRWVEAIEPSVLAPVARAPERLERLEARARWTRADTQVLDRFRHGDEGLYVPGPDAELRGGTFEGPTAMEIWSLRGPATAFEEGALPRVMRPLRRYLIVEEYEGQHDRPDRAGGLYALCSHPDRGRVLVCVERWLDVPGRLLAARELLAQPARWGHFREGSWSYAPHRVRLSDRELFLCLDGRLQLRLRSEGVQEAASLKGLLGLPIGDQGLDIASWWRVHGFRSGRPLRRVATNRLQLQPERVSWLELPTLEPLAGAWAGQRAGGAVRIEGRAKWIPQSEAPPDPSRVRHPWRPWRHR